MSNKPLLAHFLVPVASERDAAETASALAPYAPETVTVVHVVEKGEGMPQDAPVEQPRSVSAAAVGAFREVFPDADSVTVLHGNVVESIVETAEEIGASAIAFHPRKGGRLQKFLAGDHSLRLVTESDRPVISLPDGEN